MPTSPKPPFGPRMPAPTSTRPGKATAHCRGARPATWERPCWPRTSLAFSRVWVSYLVKS